MPQKYTTEGSRTAKMRNKYADGGPVKSAKRWGAQSGPLPINIEGADYNVRYGTASGKVDPTGGVKYSPSGDWKARK